MLPYDDWLDNDWCEPPDEPEIRPDRVPRIEQIEGAIGAHRRRHETYHLWLKKRKSRAERRRAKRNPECIPTYGRYHGYEW